MLTRSRRVPAAALAITLVAGAFAWYLGADVWHAILVGAIAATLLSITDLVAATADDGGDWPVEDRSRPGRRTDIEDLTRSLTVTRGRVGGVAMGRVRRVAEHRLASRDLDLRAPQDRTAIERLIGSAAYATLARERPTQRALVDCLDALDALDAIDPGARAATTTTRETDHAR